MKFLTSLITLLAFMSATCFAGQIQQQGFKTQAQCTAAGVSFANCLLLTAQSWDDVNGMPLHDSIANGVLGGGSGGGGLNLLALKDQKFEQATTGWTATGGTAAVSSSSPLYDTQSLLFTASATAQSAQSPLLTIPAGLQGKNGAAYCTISSSSSDLVLKVLDNSSNVLSTSSIPAASSAPYPLVSVSFIFPSSGSVQLKIVSASAETAKLDNCYLGDANGSILQSVSQARKLGSLVYTNNSSCAFFTTTSSSYNSFAQTGTCNLSASGSAVSQPSGVFGITIANPPGPGTYAIRMQFPLDNSSGNVQSVRFTDGTTNSNPVRYTGSNGVEITNYFTTFDYTSSPSGPLTFTMQGQSDSGQTLGYTMVSANDSFAVEVIYYPSGSQLAVNPNTTPTEWSGNVTGCSSGTFVTTSGLSDMGTCAGATLTSTSTANMGTVSMGSGQAGWLVFTPPVAGTYEVCASGTIGNSGGGTGAIAILDTSGTVQQQIQSGTGQAPFHICADVKAASVAAQTVKLQAGGNTSGTGLNIINAASGAAYLVSWTIKNISQGMNAPIVISGPRSEVQVNGSNGQGSTNTMFRRFTNIQKNLGTDITYADSATLGASFTINSAGVYCASYGEADGASGSARFAITVNDTLGTTALDNNVITYAQGMRAYSRLTSTTTPVTTQWCGNLSSGDVVRAHTDGSFSASGATVTMVNFSIAKVSN